MNNRKNKVYGILLAAGSGVRMGGSIPKQFLQVCGKPIIYYPLVAMTQNPIIDSIIIVCKTEYIDEVKEIVNKYGFDKAKWVVEGGSSCQESTWKGLQFLKNKITDEDIILIHMSSYPLANVKIMNKCIDSAQKNGNGCTARPIVYSSYITEDRKTSVKQIDRDKLMLCTVPYAFKFGECFQLYNRAFAENKGITGNVFTNTLYCDYGKRIYFTEDSELNLKITNPEDLLLMEAILNLDEKKGVPFYE